MNIYKGSCHCGQIAFEVHKKEPIEVLIDCNCTVCTKKGLVHTPVENDELKILSGEDTLSLYQFGTKTAKYWFCPTCGVEPFHRSRGNPQRYSVNARCLDDFYEILEGVGLNFLEARVHPMDNGSADFQARTNPYRDADNKPESFVDDKSPALEKLRQSDGGKE